MEEGLNVGNRFANGRLKTTVWTCDSLSIHVDPDLVFSSTTTMATPADVDYDKLTPEERAVYDKEEKAREIAEQASM